MAHVYKTIAGIATAKHIVKKSRFIGEATTVDNDIEAKAFVTDVKNRVPKATHYCYAYSFGCESDKTEYSTDAGEPIHSAGPPILNAIRANKLYNIIIVVARYYGGIKLGIGGLIRAYGECARACIENATVEKQNIYKNVRITAQYRQIGAVVSLCKRFGGKVTNIEYNPKPQIAIQIQHKGLETFHEQLRSIGITKNDIQ